MEVNDPIIYDEARQILICTQHGYAITKVDQHLRDAHRHLSLAQRKHIQELHVHQPSLPPDAIPQPRPFQDPIEGLAPPIRAYLCEESGCGFVSSHIIGIQRHAREQHQWRKTEVEETYWQSVYAQTFFTAGGRRKYFPVRVPSDYTPPDEPPRRSTTGPRQPLRPVAPDAQADLDAINAEWAATQAAHERSLQRLDENTLKQDRTGWYTRTGWPGHFAGRNLQFLSHASRLPDRDEQTLVAALGIFDQVATKSLRGLSTLDREARRWLKSPHQHEVHVRPLNRLQNQESEYRYFGYFRRFICYIYRVWLAEEERDDDTTTPVSIATRNATTRTAQTTHQDHDHSDDDDDGSTSESYDDPGDGEDDGDDDESVIHRPTRNIRISREDHEDHQGHQDHQDILEDARELFPWDDRAQRQRQCVSDFFHALQDGTHDDERLQSLMMDILYSFIFHEVGGEVFRSGLIHFLAVLGIDGENDRFRQAVHFSYIIAGMVYCMRVLGAEMLMPSDQREDQRDNPSERERFLECRRRYLADGTGTPMSEMLSLLAYGKHIAMNTSNAGSVTWSRDKKTMFFHGFAIPLGTFRLMVHDSITRTEDILWKKLMWVTTKAERFTVDLDGIVDDVTFTRRGWSFIRREANGLLDGRQWMLDRMVSQRRHRLRSQGHWQLRAVRRWLASADRFLEGLLFAVHATYGQVARGTEITAIRFRNGALQGRNVFIIDGMVCIITQYHKSQELFDRPKIISRFLPWRVGQLMVIYLVYVQPFREQLLVSTQNQTLSDHIWHDPKGPWETDRLTRVLKRETALGLGERFTTLDFRHIVISIGRVVVSESFARGYKEEIGEVEEPEVEEEDGLELQSGRGEGMGAMRYGVRVDIVQHLTARALEVFRQLSEGWHRYLQLASDAQGPITTEEPITAHGSITTQRPTTIDAAVTRITADASTNIITNTSASNAAATARNIRPPPSRSILMPPYSPQHSSTKRPARESWDSGGQAPLRWKGFVSSHPGQKRYMSDQRTRATTESAELSSSEPPARIPALLPSPQSAPILLSPSVPLPLPLPLPLPIPIPSSPAPVPIPSPPPRRRSVNPRDVEQAMHRLFGDGPVAFHSIEQEEGLFAVLEGQTPMVVVLPTGGGKTLLAMIPAMLETDGVTIFVAPFRALVNDLVSRFRGAGIDCIEWQYDQVDPHRVVVVSADIAVNTHFIQYARLMEQHGQLRRIFIDECHLTFTASDWRPKLAQLSRLRTLYCPMILLTATLPPSQEAELEQAMEIRNARYIRASTIRPRHRYYVHWCQRATLFEEAVRICRRRQRHLRPGERAVVYCCSRDRCEQLAAALGCLYYHAGRGDRADVLKRWMAEGGFLVATAAYGTGVDVDMIVYTLHVGPPWTMIDFAQESGRSGRAGEYVDSVILVAEGDVARQTGRGMATAVTTAMAAFITTTTCRRRVMSAYLDGPELAQSCLDGPDWALCDRCGEGRPEYQQTQRRRARERQMVHDTLDTVVTGCALCWIRRVPDWPHHGMQGCRYRVPFESKVNQFRRQIVYQADSHSCFRCGFSQTECATGQSVEERCAWPGVMAPVLYGVMESRTGYETIQGMGYMGARLDWRAYGRWIGQRHVRRIWGERMSNGMAVLIDAIRKRGDAEVADDTDADNEDIVENERDDENDENAGSHIVQDRDRDHDYDHDHDHDHDNDDNYMTDERGRDRYVQRLRMVQGLCMICSILGPVQRQDIQHDFRACRNQEKFRFMDAKKAAIYRGRQRGVGWMPRMVVCHWCGNPYDICVLDGDQRTRAGNCEYPDIVFMCGWALFHQRDRWGQSLGQITGQGDGVWSSEDDWMDWLGRGCVLYGMRASQAVRMADWVMGQLENPE